MGTVVKIFSRIMRRISRSESGGSNAREAAFGEYAIGLDMAFPLVPTRKARRSNRYLTLGTFAGKRAAI
jgi:hypothetical protein